MSERDLPTAALVHEVNLCHHFVTVETPTSISFQFPIYRHYCGLHHLQPGRLFFPAHPSACGRGLQQNHFIIPVEDGHGPEELLHFTREITIEPHWQRSERGRALHTRITGHSPAKVVWL